MLVVFLLPVGKSVVSKSNILVLLALAVLALLVNGGSLEYVFRLGMVVVLIWFFGFAFTSPQKHLFVLGLMFVAFTSLSAISGLINVAEFFAVGFFVCLTVLVLKRFFYAKIFEN